MSIYARALNLTFSWPIDTRNLNCALRMRWHGSHLLTVSWKLASVSGVTALIPDFCRRLNNFSEEGCAKSRYS